jgi:hypothetical protein
MYQLAIIYSKWPWNIPTFPIPRPSKIYPNWDFWFENIQSGSPGCEVAWPTSDAGGRSVSASSWAENYFFGLGKKQSGVARWFIFMPKMKNPNLGKFCRILQCKMFSIFYGLSDGHLAYLTAIWYFLWPFGIFCGHLVFSVAIWYFLWPFGIFCGHLYVVHMFIGFLKLILLLKKIYELIYMCRLIQNLFEICQQLWKAHDTASNKLFKSTFVRWIKV